MENRSTLLDLMIEGPFQLDQLFRIQEVQFLPSSQGFLNFEPNLLVLNLLSSGKDTELNQLMDVAVSDLFLCYLGLLSNVTLEKGGVVSLQSGFGIIVLRVTNSHEVDLADPAVIVHRWFLFAPELVGLLN